MSIKSIIPELQLYTEEENLSGIPSIEELLQKMISDLRRVDLVRTLEDDFQDELLKYRKRDAHDEVDELKIPQDLYLVAINHEIWKVARNRNWLIAKQHEVLYLYNGVFWQKVSDEHIGIFFGLAATRLGFYSPAKARTHNFSKQGMQQMYASARLMHADLSDDIVRINLLNGTLEIDSSGHRFKDHDSDDYLTYVLPFEYDTQAKASVFERYLTRVLPDKSSQMVLQEFLGYVFVKHLKLEKALILLGEGQNGKSVMFEIVMELFGKVNVSTKSLGDLTDRDSGNDNRAKLADKLLNYGSEIRGKDIDADMFKRLVSGEPVAAREKYKTSFDLENKCKFMFNANKLPHGAEQTDAYYRRFIIVPFTVKISEEEKDPELHRKIISGELPGVLNWVIEGLDRLLMQKGFTKCVAADEALTLYQKESNTVIGYVEEYGLVPDRRSFRPVSDLYREYSAYCRDSGYRAVAKNDFSKELTKLGFEKHRTSKGRGFFASKTEYNDANDTVVAE
jgi:putative DNA primase/helicase